MPTYEEVHDSFLHTSDTAHCFASFCLGKEIRPSDGRCCLGRGFHWSSYSACCRLRHELKNASDKSEEKKRKKRS
ncbi:hypothetical protein GW17_00033582 [Ensete ventricosum]|nr:hypothetical protein GW17_00033582 [Ensete ventricosum]